jgi:hypothetical protein
MDLYSLSKRLVNINVKNKTIIISASAWQINDGSIEDGYFRIEAFNDLSFHHKLKLYSNYPNGLKKLLLQQLYSSFQYGLTIGKRDVYINQGYTIVGCREFDTLNMFKNHPWFRKINTFGIKRKLLREALSELNKLKCEQIIIYNAPVYSNFKKLAIKNGVWVMEDEYCKAINEMIKIDNLKNITFYDLRSLQGFTRNDFYDPLHLCEDGVNKFSRKIISEFNLPTISLEPKHSHRISN